MADQLRVMIDARMLIGRFSGVGRFVTSLIDGLQCCGGVEVVALCGEEAAEQTSLDSGVEVVRSPFRRRDRSALRRLVWEERHLRGIIKRAKVDLFHATWNSGVPAFCPVPVVLTVHDLIPWLNANEHVARIRDRLAYRAAMRLSAARATAITAVSEFSRGQIVDCLGADAARVTTVYNGAVVPPADVSMPPSPQGAPYVLYVGGHQRRKNVVGLFRVMAEVWASGHKNLELHLTGRPEWLEAEAADVYGSLPDRSRVRFLGHPDDRALAREYAHARAMVFLSLDEGFGLPVIEAMGHGCPVIVSNRAALPEVAGDAAVIVHPDDAQAVVGAIDRLSGDAAWRGGLVAKGLIRAKRFTWRHTAERMIHVYRTVSGRIQGSRAVVAGGILAGARANGSTDSGTGEGNPADGVASEARR
ncbi:MAG: glycosyltransferase family 4 protein [Phycisphaerae bacterium]